MPVAHEGGTVAVMAALPARLRNWSWARALHPSGRVPDSELSDRSKAVRAARALHDTGKVPASELAASESCERPVSCEMASGSVPVMHEKGSSRCVT